MVNLLFCCDISVTKILMFPVNAERIITFIAGLSIMHLYGSVF